MAQQAHTRAPCKRTVKRRMQSGMTYEDAKSMPTNYTGGERRLFVPDARQKAVVRLNRVRVLLALCEATLRRIPRSVKANARKERLTNELAFLESLFERQ